MNEVTKEFERTVACFGMTMVTNVTMDQFADSWGWCEVPSRAAVLYTPKRTIVAGIFEEGTENANQNVSFWVAEDMAKRDEFTLFTNDEGGEVMMVCAQLDVIAEV